MERAEFGSHFGTNTLFHTQILLHTLHISPFVLLQGLGILYHYVFVPRHDTTVKYKRKLVTSHDPTQEEKISGSMKHT